MLFQNPKSLFLFYCILLHQVDPFVEKLNTLIQFYVKRLLIEMIYSGTALIRKQKKSEAHNSNDNNRVDTKNFGKSVNYFPASILMLLKNLPFVFTTLAIFIEGISFFGLALFLPKIIQNQFQQTPGNAVLQFGEKTFLKTFLDYISFIAQSTYRHTVIFF